MLNGWWWAVGVLALHLTGCVILTLAQQLQSARQRAKEMEEACIRQLGRAYAELDCVLVLIDSGLLQVHKDFYDMKFEINLTIDRVISERRLIRAFLKRKGKWDKSVYCYSKLSEMAILPGRISRDIARHFVPDIAADIEDRLRRIIDFESRRR